MEPVITAQVAKSIMDSLVVPLLKGFANDMKLKWDTDIKRTESHFAEYFNRTYSQLSVMNTLALKNQQLSLLKVYQPLTITVDHSKSESFKIERFPYELMDNVGKLLITDTAGMGKSTISKFLFIRLVEDKLGIPIFIELRKLNKKNTVIKEIQYLLNGIGSVISEELLIALLKKGNFYFILDGFDEIGISHKDDVIEDLKNFIANLSDNNYFILTSRPETLLSTFGDFKASQIQPLKEQEAFALLAKYDDNGETSSKLIKELKSERNESVKEFLKNPLLVSLLFIVYDHKAMIPLKKHLFYSQVYDALFESHDLTKGAQNIHVKVSGLDRDDFEKILRYVGYKSFKTNTLQYSHDQLLKLIDEAKSKFWTSLNFQPSNFLKDLITTVPLFIKDGVEYKWAHKSLSEYFAAKFIFLDTKAKQAKVLTDLYCSEDLPRFINLLDIYYDLDVIGFKKSILLPLLESYGDYLSNFEESDMSFFLRNLCFLRNVKIKLLNDKNFPNVFSKELRKYLPNARIMTIRSLKSDVALLIIDDTGKCHMGKRLLLLKLYEKKVHKIKSYQLKRVKPDWVMSLKQNIWFELDDIVNEAGENSEKLGEFCDLITRFEGFERVYIEKDDLVDEIKMIKSELEAQDSDFDF